MTHYRVVAIVLDPVGKYSIPAALSAPLVNKVTTRTLDRSRVLCPVRTGNLRASLQKTMRPYRTKVVGTVQTRVKYATYVHQGTAPHDIFASRRQFLRFEVGGQVIFRRFVHHPGTKPRPFLFRALVEESRSAGFVIRESSGVIPDWTG